MLLTKEHLIKDIEHLEKALESWSKKESTCGSFTYSRITTRLLEPDSSVRVLHKLELLKSDLLVSNITYITDMGLVLVPTHFAPMGSSLSKAVSSLKEIIKTSESIDIKVTSKERGKLFSDITAFNHSIYDDLNAVRPEILISNKDGEPLSIVTFNLEQGESGRMPLLTSVPVIHTRSSNIGHLFIKHDSFDNDKDYKDYIEYLANRELDIRFFTTHERYAKALSAFIGEYDTVSMRGTPFSSDAFIDFEED